MPLAPDQLATIVRHGISRLRLSVREWQAIASTRRGTRRFSLTFPHEVARTGRRGGLALIEIFAEDELDGAELAELGFSLLVGRVRSVGATATLDSRVVLDFVLPVTSSLSILLLEGIVEPQLRPHAAALAADTTDYRAVSERLGERIVELLNEVSDNTPALQRILAEHERERRFTSARALQQDAVSLALKAFGATDEAASISLSGRDTALATVPLREDAVIEHDARWVPGWDFIDSDVTGRATFARLGEQLDIWTANHRPLEHLLGVDLIYLNESRGALVMVQYKMMEPQPGGKETVEVDGWSFGRPEEPEWLVRINDQFRDEVARMKRFDRDLEPTGDYRLHPGAFFFKLVKRNAAVTTSGILLSLGHLEHLAERGELEGPKGGLRINYRQLGGHYLRGEGFVELVRSGYVGTRGATTDHLLALIRATLSEDRAVVAAIQSAVPRD
ncbi:hypothetical protein NKJ28_14475 [Mesorhizobium sp. M0145]|uniref:hypothetical protein n=1 Tax=Mesorhizobium sp. M0145 TaxID=2956895 RepID=UPI0033377800